MLSDSSISSGKSQPESTITAMGKCSLWASDCCLIISSVFSLVTVPYFEQTEKTSRGTSECI